MISFNRTQSTNPDFIYLTKQLDKELLEIYKSEQAKFDEHNILDSEVKAVVIYNENLPIACGAFKELKDNKTVEIKRMFADNNFRLKGIGKLLLIELEKWASELNYKFSILETGDKQTAAIFLYNKLGYIHAAKFPPYENMHDSICMKKKIK